MTRPLRVLIGCECSGIVRRAAAREAMTIWSIANLKPVADPAAIAISSATMQDLHDELGLLAVLHPPCTRLTNSGVRWLSVPPPGRTLPEMWVPNWTKARPCSPPAGNAPIPLANSGGKTR